MLKQCILGLYLVALIEYLPVTNELVFFTAILTLAIIFVSESKANRFLAGDTILTQCLVVLYLVRSA